MFKIDKNLIEQIKKNKLYKNAKYLIIIKLAIKLLFIVFALFWTKEAKTQEAIIYYFSAYTKYENNSYIEALQNIDLAIELEANNYIYYILKAEIFFDESNFLLAKNNFLSAEKIKQNSSSLQLSYCYSNLSNIDSSIFFLKQYLSKTEKLSYFEIFNNHNYKNISNSIEWKKLWEKNWYAEIYKELDYAKYDFKYGKKLEALEKVNLIIKKQNKFAEAYFFKSQILSDANNYQEAIKNLSKSIELKPNRFDYYFQRAILYLELKKYKNSISDLDKSLVLNPYNLEIFKYRALACNYSKKYEQAKKDIQFYNKFYSNNIKTKFFEAEILYNCGEYLESIKILNILISENYKNSDCYFLRGKSYLNSYNYDLAYNDFNTALDLKPSLTEVYYYRGQSNFKLNKIENACNDWSKSLENKDYKANEYYIKYCEKYQKNN